MYDLDMDYMIEHLELCIFLEFGICLKKKKQKGELCNYEINRY